MESEENKLFVGGISRETTEDALRDYFGKYGDVVGSVVAKDRYTASPRGFAFVSFSDQSSVDRALQQDTHIILERKVEVKRAIPKSEQQQQQNQPPQSTTSSRNCRTSDNFRTKKIFVGGLSSNLSEDMFRSYFEKYGRITDVVVMHDSVTRRPRGFGFITFDSEDAVEDVVQKSFYEICGKSVEVKKAVPKEGSNHVNTIMRAGGGLGFPLDSFQHMNYSLYPPSYGFHPGHGSFTGYDGFGVFYNANLFGGGYHNRVYDGLYHGVAPVMPSSSWNGHAFGGSPLPYFNAATVYPTYLNGVGSMNGHNGIFGLGVQENLARLSLGDAKAVSDVTRASVNGESLDC